MSAEHAPGPDDAGRAARLVSPAQIANPARIKRLEVIRAKARELAILILADEPAIAMERRSSEADR